MKTLTTLTAVAALIAGMSIASAQTAPAKSMDKGAAATKMAPAPKAAANKAAANNGKFCTTTTTGGVLNCKFATLAACKKAAKSNDETCAPNPKLGTTGAK